MKSRFEQIRLRFQLWVLLQIILLAVTLTGLVWALGDAGLPAVSAVLLLAVAAQVAILLGYVSAQHRKLERFLDALAFDDLSLQLTEEDWDRQLAQAANHIITTVRDARVETEAQANYLNALVKHLPVAIVSYRDGGEVVLQNNAMRQLFQLSRLTNLSDLGVYGEHVPATLAELQPGQRRLVRAIREDQVLELKVSATEVRIAGEDGGDRQTLLALENIHSELGDREINAWRDLIRVLTHEIMNSVTPIASLARTVGGLIDDVREETPVHGEKRDEHLDDMADAMATIAKRSDGLIHFVDGYRRLTGIPQPTLKELRVDDLLADVARLAAEDTAIGDTTLAVSVEPPSLTLSADSALIQQVLINLVRNAAHAVAELEQPSIEISAGLSHGRVQLVVSDNGVGIPSEDLPQIFIPFFTTRKDGSGVGMTLARQIMSAHGGEVFVRSAPGKGTQVTLVF